MKDFTDRVAIVTGGGNGIGKATARLFAERGASVVVTDIDESAAMSVAETLGEGAMGLRHDVANGQSSSDVVTATLERFGRIDILVNNAGVGPNPQPTQDLSEEEYDRVMNVNAKGVFLVTRAVMPHMIAQASGRIINMSSVVGKKASAFVLPYSMSKWAVIGLTQCLAREVATANITVNAVCPGIIKTPLHEKVAHGLMEFRGQSEDEVWDWFLERIPMQRFQEPEDIGEMVLFLASDRAKNITGSAFNVNGGMEFN